MTTFNLNKIANLKEADYSKISSRVKAFCSTFETAQILTEIVKDELGHVIFKAHTVVDGTIKGTGHAHEVEGSNNINNTSHYEVCENIAVGRALAFTGYSETDSLASYEEIENSKLQETQVALHKETLEVAANYLSVIFKKAIEERNEEKIAECQRDIRFNEALRQAVNTTLEDHHKDILIERGRRIQEERKYAAKKRVNENLNG
ncbi:hypothetical protein OAJ80_00330 [Candidatus Thioglobus sp.]|nr:hypothetical protein [Candidatus Thioglobus sp.]